MREKYRKSIASLNKFPQFTTMNVIDGQAGLISYSSLIFYSLTIDNILNIIVLLILAAVSIITLTGENGIIIQAGESKEETRGASVEEAKDLWKQNQKADEYIGTKTAQDLEALLDDLESQKLITSVERTTIEETGRVIIGSRTIIFWENNVEMPGTSEISASDIANTTDKSKYYDEIVTGYECEYSEAVKEWRIFYADEKNIYLIAGDYISYSYCPSSANYTIYKNADYRLSFNNVISDYSGSSDIINTNIQALNNDYFTKNYTSTNNNMKAVAYMLDTNIWSVYQGEKAEYAIGGTTIELLMKSYSQKYGVDYRAQAIDNKGYKISRDGGNNWENYYSGMLNPKDRLYVIEDTTNASAMWLASPSASSENDLMYVNFDGNVDSNNYSFANPGFRPIVCLKSDTKLEDNGDGTYTIK